jgi:hypothetical protein
MTRILPSELAKGDYVAQTTLKFMLSVIDEHLNNIYGAVTDQRCFSAQRQGIYTVRRQRMPPNFVRYNKPDIEAIVSHKAIDFVVTLTFIW